MITVYTTYWSTVATLATMDQAYMTDADQNAHVIKYANKKLARVTGLQIMPKWAANYTTFTI